MGLEHVLVAGGGTGGHVFPALAVVRELAERNCRVSWLGRETGMERSLIEERGLPYFGLPAAPVVGRGLPRRAMALGRTARSALRARSLIRRLDIDAVLGTGGYASAPGVLGARIAGRPAVLLEPNATAGTANRWLSRWADAAAVVDLASARGLKCRVESVGVPVREEFRREFEPPAESGPIRILILGGSQGARQLNELLPAALAEVAGVVGDLEVTHQTGKDHLEEVRRAYRELSSAGVSVQVAPFLEDVAGAMSAAHLVVSRAGAITLAEICAIGRAALLLPLESVDSHQVANARALVACGGAEMIERAATDAAQVERAVNGLLMNRERLTTMAKASRSLYRQDAARDVADLLAEVAGGS